MIQVAKIIHKGQEQFWQVQKTAMRVLFNTRPGWALLVQPIGARKVKENEVGQSRRGPIRLDQTLPIRKRGTAMKVKHLKTGNTYRIITDSAIDATNANPTYQKRMVIYSSEKDGQVYCREHGEFWQRFELVKNRCCVCGNNREPSLRWCILWLAMRQSRVHGVLNAAIQDQLPRPQDGWALKLSLRILGPYRSNHGKRVGRRLRIQSRG